MGTYDIKEIPISQLQLDINNPRFENINNQREAIASMIEDQDDKLIRLANDIVTAGMNPSDVLIVTPHDEEEDLYVVLEGNRRITALKLLHTPTLANQKKAIRQRFELLSKRFKQSPIDQIRCVIFADKKEAERWIELKHTGENKGVGTVRWDTQQQDRFIEKKKGVASLQLQAIEFIKNNSHPDEDILNKINSIPITSLGRLLNDPRVRETLGLSTTSGKLTTKLPKEEVLKGLIKILTDLAHEDFTVKAIYYKNDREKYIESLDKDDLPDFSKETKKYWDLESPPNSSPPNSADKTTQPTPTKRSKPISTNRKVVIPPSCPLRIDENRINKIFWELRKLNVDDFTNAAAVMLRVFLELSADHYVEKNKIETKQNPKKEPTLAGKIQAIARFMENKKILNKNKLKGIRTATTSKDSIFSTDTFNAYVHNRYFSPSPILIKETWDNMQEFMQKIWE